MSNSLAMKRSNGSRRAGGESSTATAETDQPLRKGATLSGYIRERFEDFSRSQKDVARYIVDHLEEAAFQTAEELARRADTSSSTVVRFSQARTR
jgi:Helix-turn-helix domain, rpiR family